MKQLIRSFILICLNCYSCVSIASYPGVTPGSFSVTDSGEASYLLPITTPAGVNGISPNLSISYNSSGGNGLLGVGFYLAGFKSSIDRCGSSHVTDGHASGVVYSIFDKLCMDGQRLILSSGAHWSDGAIYHTENESFSKII